MATLRIKVENGRFTGVISGIENFISITECGNKLEGIDWDAEISLETSEIICRSGRICRKFPLRDGVLGLAQVDGRRYAFFRDAKFQAFLDKFGIESVIGENPNQQYPDALGLPNVGWWAVVVSDGTGTDDVSGASWVMYRSCWKDTYFNNNPGPWFLYTKRKDVMSLEGEITAALAAIGLKPGERVAS